MELGDRQDLSQLTSLGLNFRSKLLGIGLLRRWRQQFPPKHWNLYKELHSSGSKVLEIFRNRYHKLPTSSFSVTPSAAVEVSKFPAICWKRRRQTFDAQLQYIREGKVSPVDAM